MKNKDGNNTASALKVTQTLNSLITATSNNNNKPQANKTITAVQKNVDIAPPGNE